MNTPTVQTYQLTTCTGLPIRKATKVVYPNGQEIAFTERMTQRDALQQAAYHLEKIARRNAGFSEARA